jgi:hypothetical protein
VSWVGRLRRKFTSAALLCSLWLSGGLSGNHCTKHLFWILILRSKRMIHFSLFIIKNSTFSFQILKISIMSSEDVAVWGVEYWLKGGVAHSPKTWLVLSRPDAIAVIPRTYHVYWVIHHRPAKVIRTIDFDHRSRYPWLSSSTSTLSSILCFIKQNPQIQQIHEVIKSARGMILRLLIQLFCFRFFT